jgi:pimeloyl-ACP methyl ester carboxylesterase
VPRRGAFALVLALAVSAVGCANESKEPAATGEVARAAASLEYTGAIDGFYVPPDPLPAGVHGALLRYQRLGAVPGGTAYRILYLSTSVKGKPIAVSGMAALPTDGGDGRPVLSWAHGTTGLADACAPSKLPLDGQTAALLDPFLRHGWVVAATDYEGLGTPGLHPYIAGISEGRGTLDAVRAVKQLPDARAGKDTIIWGHSQGGHAALFANQLAASWTPELKLDGIVAGAPPSELLLIAAALKGGNYQGYLAMVAGGLHAAYPEADLSQVVTAKGRAELHVLDEGCTDQVFAVYNHLSYDEFAAGDPAAVEPWKSILAENDPGHVKTDSPILLIHGLADQQIPPVASELLFKRLCGLGQVVERRTYPGMGHAEVIAPSFAGMLTWMSDRVAGKPAVSGCPSG